MGSLGSSSPSSLAHGAPGAPGRFPWAQDVYTATGVRIPPGSLDRWFAARRTASDSLVEVVLFGDSTMYGQTTTGPYYSPLQRVRELLGATYADGGHGNLNGVDDVTSTGDSLTIGQGFASGSVFVLPGETAYSEASGDHQTFTRVGRYLTLWYTRFNSSGRFTYEIDGSDTEVAVDPAPPTFGSVYTFAYLLIDLGTDASHTIKIRNKGGRLLVAPAYATTATTGEGSGDSIPAGTYEYAAAFASTAGAIGPLGTARTVTITGTQAFSLVFPASPFGGPTTNLYRRVSGVGNYKLVGTASTNTGSPYTVADTAGASPGIDYVAGASPVLESTLKWVNVATVVTKAAGIVLHNIAARGSGSGMAANPFNLAISLGLDLEPLATTAALDRALDMSPGARRPALAIFSHGINDQQGSGSDNSAGLKANTITAIRTARHAGADALVLIPAFETAQQQQNADLYRAALKEAAEGEDAPWVDIGMGGALPDIVAGQTTNPHLTIAQYTTQGDFIHAVLGAT